MKIGIVSDSHGKAKLLARAMAACAERRVEAVVHCGDVGSVECVELLGAGSVTVAAVVGNMDKRHLAALARAAKKAGIELSTEMVDLPVGDGRRLAVTHGHDEALLGELIAGGQFAYVCHGHTHRARDERLGRVRVINPGALHDPKHPGGPTACVLDTETDVLEMISLV